MTRFAMFALVLMACVTAAGAARAQAADVVWIQIEAQPDLTRAQDRARDYADRLPDVVGFAVGGRWHAVLLGPYLRSDAEQVLRVYRAERQIPRDSFITFTSRLQGQFWPPGQDLLDRGTLSVPAAPATGPRTAPDTPERIPSDESPAEARRSEARLDRAARMDLQRALQWAGVYRATIDGAFGAGTRRSMADWQRANGFEPTGVLTTTQRATLMDAYNAPLRSAGLAPVADAGIRMDLPLALVAFDRHVAPFAHYTATGDSGVQVVLISQSGDRDTLFGLYEVLQTLSIVPPDGPRSLRGDRFDITGRDARRLTHVQAQLQDGEIKGFALVWPQDDAARQPRVLAAMQDSFAPLPGTLDPSLGADLEQDVDLVAGLRIRTPRLSRSGFFVDAQGGVVTTTDVVEGCARLTIDHDHAARVIARDDTLGVALLQPVDLLAPPARARFATQAPRLQSEIAVAGYAFEGRLGAPSVSFGRFAEDTGLRGDARLDRLALTVEPGDAGGPVLDDSGAVVGMLLPRADGPQSLPEHVNQSVDHTALRALLNGAGRADTVADGARAPLDPVDLRRQAEAMTVLVSCWD
ncbi:MAG: serine protease [Marinibacterium sp.]|nr:serine protease [Marinibacterium sp.]